MDFHLFLIVDLVENFEMDAYDHLIQTTHQQNMVNTLNLSLPIHTDIFLATSGSDNESAAQRRRLGKLVESRQEIDNNYLTPQSPIPGSMSAASMLEQDDNSLKSPSTPVASSIPRKLANDLSQVKSKIHKKVN
jgi:hypothetical protein